MKLLSSLFFTLALIAPVFSSASDAPAEAEKPQDAVEQSDEGKPSEEKLADIHKMMRLTGVGDRGEMIMQQLYQYLEQMRVTGDEEFMAKFNRAVDPQELIDQCALVVHQHYTHDEVKGLIEFYKSDLGKKMLKTEMLITQECGQVSEQWARVQVETALGLLEELEEDVKEAAAEAE